MPHYEFYCEKCEKEVTLTMSIAERERGGFPLLAVGSGEAGREIEGPMVIVILGGLLTSTVLNSLVRPTLALRDGRFERRSVSVG